MLGDDAIGQVSLGGSDALIPMPVLAQGIVLGSTGVTGLFAIPVAETVGVDLGLTVGWRLLDALAQGVGCHPDAAAKWLTSDTLTTMAWLVAQVTYAPSYVITNGIGLHHADMVYAWRPGAQVAETLRALDDVLTRMGYQGVGGEQVGVGSRVTVHALVQLLETIGLADVELLVRGVAVVEQLFAADAVTHPLIGQLVIAQQLAVHPQLREFFGASVINQIAVATAHEVLFRPAAAAAEQIGVGATTTGAWVLRLDCDDTIDLTAEQALQAIYQGDALLDQVHITAAYVSPSNTFTTFAVNTRNVAVTEYTNYVFNSFARLGNDYIGANESGLYRLRGTRDGDENIVAQIKSGLFSLGGSRLTSFAAAYLGLRSEGDFVLRIETGDGRTMDYALKAQSMRSTKVRFGKGLRTRYFSFELIGEGDDFDLESIEFVPIVAQRRV